MMKRKRNAAIAGIVGVITAAGAVAGSNFRKKYNNDKETRKKVGSYYHILNKWLRIRQSGETLVSYFAESGYRSIAIYGYKELGERLYDELRNSDIKVSYIIDQAADHIYVEADSYRPDDVLDDVDAVIVTASYYFDEIRKVMSEKLDCPIISIKEVVDAMDRQ